MAKPRAHRDFTNRRFGLNPQTFRVANFEFLNVSTSQDTRQNRRDDLLKRAREFTAVMQPH